MYKAVIFDMYETLITIFDEEPYYSAGMAKDAGVTTEQFRRFWRTYEYDRSIGRCDLAFALKGTLSALGIPDENRMQMMLDKRLRDQRRIFSAVRPDIIAMLNSLKSMGIRIGLISNCYLEERDCIRSSVLATYFDVMMLSCEQGICKPDPEIFARCLQELDMYPGEILYVGDGGSRELEQASGCGMQAVQACWFIRDDESDQPCRRMENFLHADSPDQIVTLALSGLNAKRHL